MAAQARRELGSLDILVNNAGVQFTASVQDFPTSNGKRSSPINLSGVFYVTKAAIPGMKARGWGRIINIASAHGLVASPDKSAYVAAKHGVVGLTKVTAIELANDGITVNAICPGVGADASRTEADRRARDGEGKTAEAVTHDFLAEKQPMTQFSTPEGVGALAAFLCYRQCGDDHRGAAVNRWRLGRAVAVAPPPLSACTGTKRISRVLCPKQACPARVGCIYAKHRLERCCMWATENRVRYDVSVSRSAWLTTVAADTDDLSCRMRIWSMNIETDNIDEAVLDCFI